MPTALITGATSGIGNRFAHRLAADGFDLILVARTAPHLAETAAELRGAHDVSVEVIPANLATLNGCRTVERRLADHHHPVDLLVNNAGVGLFDGDFADHSVSDEDALLQLNVRAVLRLTHAALGPMLERGCGDIINVSSMASFAPDPMSPTYAASKAWVTSFTQGLREQITGSGVNLLVLAPGLVHTQFQERAGVQPHAPDLLWLDADAVVDTALGDLRAGRGMSVPGVPYRILAVAMRLTPRRMYLPLSATLARRLT